MTPLVPGAPLPLPGLQRARVFCDDLDAPDALLAAASRSLRRSSAAARALASGSPLVRRALDEDSGSGGSSWPHGRFPAAFAEPAASPFEKAVLRAARDDEAFARLVSPLIAASALRHPRAERSVLIARWPARQQEPVRAAFAWLRSQEARLETCKNLPQTLMPIARCQDLRSTRAAAACAVASVFGRWWSEELFVLDPTCAWLSVNWSTSEEEASHLGSWWMTTEPTWV
jgi:hypothetical protein